MDIKDVLLGVKSWSLNKFYTKEEVQRLINSLVHFEVVSELPSVSDGDSNVLYLVGPVGDGSDKYEEWIFTGSEYIMIGDTSVDLGGYVTTDILNSALGEYMTSSETQVALSRKYEKPASGIPAEDLADGVIPTELPASDVSAWAKAPNKPEYSWNEINEKPENVSYFNNDAGYLTEHQSLASKQDVISDLDEIRAGAALGASSLQEHQDISGKANIGDSYTKAESDEKYLTSHQDISGKANVGDSYTKAESDAKYLTEHQDISGKANSSDLAAVATSGAYSDLSGVPTIPANVSDLNNDAGYLTEHQSLAGYATESFVSEEIAKVIGGAPETLDTLKEIAEVLEDTASMSAVTEAIATKANASDVYTKAESDAKYLTEHQDLSAKANVGDSYTKAESDEKYLTEHQDISGKANSEDVYTKAESDAKYLTEHQDISGKANVGDSYTKEESDEKYLTEHQDISAKANASDVYTKAESDAKYLTEHQDISGKANIGDSYTKAESDEKYLTEHQDISGKANAADVYTKAEVDSKFGNLELDGAVVESNAYDYIYDEASWNESYANGVLKAYYEKNPSEDLIDSSNPSRIAGFNDRIYVGTITGSDAVVRFKATWAAKSQKITNMDDSSESYYMERLDKTSPYYGTDNEWRAQYPNFQGYTWVLYSDEELTVEVGKEFSITDLEFDGFEHSYLAWIANGARAPWIAPYFEEGDEDAKIIFQYEGKEDVKPWGETVFGANKKKWGVASIVNEFRDNSFLTPDCVGNANPSYDGEAGDNNFDISKFKVVLVKQEGASVKTYMENYVASKEDKANKVTVLSAEATDEQYPSAKLLLEELAKTRNLLSFALGLIEDKVYDYIYDEASWNAAYNKKNSGLKAYLDRNPDEDRWNEHENRWAWAADKVDGEWPEWCVQCWKGAISADGAKYPWVVVNLPKPFVGTIKFSYEGKEDVYPWGEAIRTFENGYGIASIPTELGDEFLLDAEGNTTFDTSKFSVTLIQ